MKILNRIFDLISFIVATLNIYNAITAYNDGFYFLSAISLSVGIVMLQLIPDK